MTTMDLSINQELMGVNNRYGYDLQESFTETDIEWNNNLFNILKTETNSNHGRHPSSFFQVNHVKENNLEVDNSLFSYSSFKKAMDLRVHKRTFEEEKRTIFEDAEQFAKHCCYKLLPITFEQVDETIIHTEHNYSLFSLNSESEPDEDCSRTMDYSQIKEKNYKRRRTKYEEGSDQERPDGEQKSKKDSSGAAASSKDDVSGKFKLQNDAFGPENSFLAQPLDLSSAPPLVQEDKTDPLLRENPSSISEKSAPDSDKENTEAEHSNGIKVTITRPDEKESYQPCDLFLNDVARLVPWLIDKDCFEVEISDRTCERKEELWKHRLYYVISESTWRLFRSTNERIVLTSDQSLGEPVRRAEKDERPSYLIFDQFSLAKSLAEYCQEIGGCFEYTCVEEEKDDESGKQKLMTHKEELKRAVESAREVVDPKPEAKEGKENPKIIKDIEKKEKMVKDEEIVDVIEKKLIKSDPVEVVKRNEILKNVKNKKKVEVGVCEMIESKPAILVQVQVSKESKKPDEGKDKKVDKKMTRKEVEKQEKNKTIRKVRKISKRKPAKKEPTKLNGKKKSVMQRERRNLVSKSGLESETSQKSDKRVGRKGRRKRKSSSFSRQEPPKKKIRTGRDETRRSTNVLEVKTNRGARKEKEKETGSKKREPKKKPGITASVPGKTQRSLRSQAPAIKRGADQKAKPKLKPSSKAKRS